MTDDLPTARVDTLRGRPGLALIGFLVVQLVIGYEWFMSGLQELCGHLRFEPETVESANCIPCRMPYITSMFMPRLRSDRPLPVLRGSKNLAFIRQFVEIADDVVFTVEYSVRAAQTAVYELLGIQRKIPPITPHDKSLRTQFEALVKAFK